MNVEQIFERLQGNYDCFSVLDQNENLKARAIMCGLIHNQLISCNHLKMRSACTDYHIVSSESSTYILDALYDAKNRNRVMLIDLYDIINSHHTVWASDQATKPDLTGRVRWTLVDHEYEILDCIQQASGRYDQNKELCSHTETIDIDLDQSELFELMLIAHKKDITLNQLVNSIVADACKNYKLDDNR